MSEWFVQNAWWIWPIAIVAGMGWEIRRLDKRIDALIALLKRRGIDIYQQPDFGDF